MGTIVAKHEAYRLARDLWGDEGVCIVDTNCHAHMKCLLYRLWEDEAFNEDGFWERKTCIALMGWGRNWQDAFDVYYERLAQ